MIQTAMSIDIILPQHAEEIKITNIINPYFIRIQKIAVDYNVKQRLFRFLQKVLNSKHKKRLMNHYTPAIGDDVIISSNNVYSESIDLPGCICRGIVTDTATETSDVFLLDYGISINVPNEILIKYSRDAVPIEPLTYTVGIYNILPMDSKSQISTKWSRNSIVLMKSLIQTSKKIYFKTLACDIKTNKEFGDLYLVVQNKIICFSKILIYSHFAIPICDEILKIIKNGNTEHEVYIRRHIKQGNTIINDDTAMESLNHNVLLCEQKNISLRQKMNDKILIRTKFACEPLRHIEDSRFTISVHKALKNHGVRTPKHIQSYMWSAIKQGLNVLAISPRNSGKAVGYTVPIINFIIANEKIILQNQMNETLTKPIALILCASINKCIDVAMKCDEILFYHNNIKCFAAFNGLLDKQIMTNVCNKFHILISTPSFLLKLLKREEFANKLNLSELSFLVIDHADILLNKYLHELMDLIRIYKIINPENKNLIHGGPMQIVTVTESWTDKLCSFVNIFMKDPYICIASFIEAAVFCRVQGRMLIRHSDKKKHELLGILGDCLKVKTIIFCLHSSEAIELNKFLLSNSIKTLLVHEEMTVNKINNIKEEWRKYVSGMYPVIICTDQVLPDLEISDIEFLIHYTITVTSKTTFNRRFSVLMDNWLLDSKNKCKVLIMFDETKENMHFKGVLDILIRLNVKLPDDWDEIANRFDLENNLKKINYSLCDSVKLFGSCEESSCPYRHRVIAEVDAPKTIISIGDELKLCITFIHNATHFSARILECIKINNTKEKEIIPFPCEILNLTMKMNQYYSDIQNRRMQKNVSVGIICILKNFEQKILRVQILNIVEKDIKGDKPKIVKVRCIDNGQVFERIYVCELYEILKEHLEYKFPIIDIYLTNVLPADNEHKWNHIATNDVNNWFKTNCNSKSFVFTKVLLHIGDSVWTDSLTIRSKVTGHPDLVSSSLRKVIIKKDHAIENKEHLNNLLYLCCKGGLTNINGYSIKLPTNEEQVDVEKNCS